MLLLKNGRIITVTNGIIEKGDVLIDKTTITAVGKNLDAPKGVKTIDCTGKIVMPGIIDAHCHVGMWEEGNGWAGEDGNEITSPATPQLRAIDAINPDDQGFIDAYTAGITAVFTGPGSANVIGGQSVVMKTGVSRVVDELIVKDPAGLKMALGENPKHCYGSKNQYPSTRMANASVMRENLYAAKNYLAKKKKGETDAEKAPEYDMKLEVLSQVLEKKITVRCHAHRADDIATMIRIKKEFDLDVTIEHATDGHKIAGFMAKNKVNAVIGPSLSARVKEELKDITFDTVAAMEKAGVLFAIMTDAPVIPINYLPMMVGLARKHGLTEDGAYKSVTINAAKICGVADRIGSLEVGKDADIAVFDGDPFDMKTNCVCTVIDGKVVHSTLK